VVSLSGDERSLGSHCTMRQRRALNIDIVILSHEGKGVDDPHYPPSNMSISSFLPSRSKQRVQCFPLTDQNHHPREGLSQGNVKRRMQAHPNQARVEALEDIPVVNIYWCMCLCVICPFSLLQSLSRCVEVGSLAHESIRTPYFPKLQHTNVSGTDSGRQESDV
jgi:hypothetical protein